MADTLTKPQRSALMAKIRSKDTKPELAVRSLLHRLGYRFRLHRRDLPGSPDIVLPKHRTVIFVHGCFWHRHAGCRHATTPATRARFWRLKFEGNMARDRRVKAALRRGGWRVVTIWECDVKRLVERPGRARRILERPQAVTAWGEAHQTGTSRPAKTGMGRSKAADTVARTPSR